jgi:hypothetical protein
MSLTKCIFKKDWISVQALLVDLDKQDDDTLLPERFRDLLVEFVRRDHAGATVFHYASSSRDVPPELIETMLDRIGPYQARLVDYDGHSAIHYAAALGSANVLAVLLQRMPFNVSRHGQPIPHHTPTPCRCAWNMYLHRQTHEMNDSTPLKTRITALMHVCSKDDVKHYAPLMELWNKTLILLHHHWKWKNARKEAKKKKWNPISSLVRWGNALDIPTAAFWLAVQTMDIDLWKPDIHGDTLLHVAAKSPPLRSLELQPNVHQYMTRHSESSQHHHGDWKKYGAQRSVITQLVRREPSAAHKWNEHHQLALHLAILHGQPWYEGIQRLLRAHPDSIDIPDGVTRLPPILLAATSPSCTLSTLFEMVRHHSDRVALLLPRTETTTNNAQETHMKKNQVQPKRSRKFRVTIHCGTGGTV